MQSPNNRRIIRQLDQKINGLQPLRESRPATGWVNLIRKTLHISLRQLGSKMAVTPQSIRSIEKREKEKTITLQTLSDAAEALDMILVYGFIPKDGSLEKLIARKAYEKAEKIVTRTSASMKLEDQENSKDRIEQAIVELAEEIKWDMPKSLWD